MWIFYLKESIDIRIIQHFLKKIFLSWLISVLLLSWFQDKSKTKSRGSENQYKIMSDLINLEHDFLATNHKIDWFFNLSTMMLSFNQKTKQQEILVVTRTKSYLYPTLATTLFFKKVLPIFHNHLGKEAFPVLGLIFIFYNLLIY